MPAALQIHPDAVLPAPVWPAAMNRSIAALKCRARRVAHQSRRKAGTVWTIVRGMLD